MRINEVAVYGIDARKSMEEKNPVELTIDPGFYIWNRYRLFILGKILL